jgi:hypothetical protein
MVRFLSLALVLGVAAPASSQTLGEAAKKEKERREAKKGTETRVITEEELKQADGKGVALPPSGAKAASPSPGSSSRRVVRVATDADAAGDVPSADADLRQRASSLRSRMTSCQGDVASAEKALRTAEQTAWRAGSSNSATSLVEEAKSRLEGAKRRCDEIEDEARRQGIPPGYLR